ncbi:NtaA/DmoA family FMN-dependent monooxygenase [Mycobacteroides abscessus]|uniref:NtaA/DmoA family FMN-dependent monooxygenase n=1 Tax=Mycobacteroides abscessus TaxID=36809 RepID=UPI000C25FB7F|nr:NtaA/DmoA family FMN-dependent monooxygenase [Mycobacteroides abscessus]RIS88083.1 LLM class flavin-dependent oxidoreductase [Mycobacteroides abscessus]
MSSRNGRQLHLLAFGNVRAGSAWRLPGVRNGPANQLNTLVATAKAAEAAKFDAVFFADGLNFGPKATWAHKSTEDFEPLTATSYLAAVTERLGLVVTGSSTFQPPYHLARQLLSLDHLSSGRAGWNLVTSFAQAAAANFGERGFLPHDERYRLAEETLQVVKSLWHSLEPDTVIEDRAAGIYSDINKIHVANHDGEFHKVKGPLGVTPSRQGHPVIFQAGSSTTGRAFAARHAEVVFTGQTDVERAKNFYRQLHQEARAAGRTFAPLVTPSLGVVVGSTEAEALAAESTIYEHFIPEYQAGWLLEVDVNVVGADLDGPVPASAFPDSTETHQTALAGYKHLATVGNPTVREFLYRTLNAFGTRFVGSAEQVADQIELWFSEGAADGFILSTSGLPGQFELFTEHVVPILVRRGLFRAEYTGSTLREHLALPWPVPARPPALLA